MKKIIVIFIAGFLSFSMVSGQFFDIGIKGGLNYSKLNFDDIQNVTSNGDEYNLMTDESFQGFHIGLMSRLNIRNFFIQPELYFNTAGSKVLIREIQAGADQEFVRQIKYNKIDLPVLAGIKIGPIHVNAGPVATVTLSKDSELSEVIPELETLSKSASIGFQAGVGVDLFDTFTLDYRYEGGLTKWGDKISVGGNDYNFDSRVVMHLLSIGIML